MHITNLRKVGATVGLAVDHGRLVVEPRTRLRYTVAKLLAISDYTQPQPAEKREWIDAPVVGADLL